MANYIALDNKRQGYSNPRTSAIGYQILYDEAEIKEIAEREVNERIRRFIASANSNDSITLTIGAGGGVRGNASGLLGVLRGLSALLKELSKGIKIDAKVAPGAIVVFFYDGSNYTYARDKIGQGRINAMEARAKASEGLVSYIYRNVRFQYSSKSR